MCANVHVQAGLWLSDVCYPFLKDGLRQRWRFEDHIVEDTQEAFECEL